MNYEDVLRLALRGRSVNAAAKEMGLPQQSLSRWVKGKNLPDYSSAAVIASEANVSLGEMMRILVEEDQRRNIAKDILSQGFRSLVDAWNRLRTGMNPA